MPTQLPSLGDEDGVTLQAHDFLGVIEGNEENHKKDHLTLSTILNSILKS